MQAQIAVMKLVGKNSKNFGAGYGGFLAFAYPISKADDATIEIGANIFTQKNSNGKYGYYNVPLKIGYRYTINREGFGFYIQPTIGYNLYGNHSYSNYPITYGSADKKFNGLIISPSVGYLFKPLAGIKFNLQAIYEVNFIKEGNLNYTGLRLSHNFSFGKKRED
jgi:hypothetical protein